MLLTLVIVELALCPPDSSIGSFPNFLFIIGDMVLPFLRGGACNGTLNNHERKYVDFLLSSEISKRGSKLYSRFFFYNTFAETPHCQRRILASFSVRNLARTIIIDV